ncbi:MAG: hypothetical protein M1401_02365 [Chloroflexi bacterium]|nr:hypothetical protein [Chloroflexota bacterium]
MLAGSEQPLHLAVTEGPHLLAGRSWYGHEFYERIDKIGGEALTATYDHEHFQAIGRKGGQRMSELVAKDKALEAAERDEWSRRQQGPRQKRAAANLGGWPGGCGRFGQSVRISLPRNCR